MYLGCFNEKLLEEKEMTLTLIDGLLEALVGLKGSYPSPKIISYKLLSTRTLIQDMET